MHGITWISGDMSYTLLKIILTKIFRNTTKIYVKGLEEKNCFVKPSIKIIDLYELKCSPLQYFINESKGSIKCFHHNDNIQNFDCALRNVLLSKLRLHKNYKIENKNNNICQFISNYNTKFYIAIVYIDNKYVLFENYNSIKKCI